MCQSGCMPHQPDVSTLTVDHPRPVGRRTVFLHQLDMYEHFRNLHLLIGTDGHGKSLEQPLYGIAETILYLDPPALIKSQ